MKITKNNNHYYYIFVYRNCAFYWTYICAYLKKEQYAANEFLHNRLGQSTFHFLILEFKASKQEHFFVFPGTKTQTFRAIYSIA